MSRFAPGFLKRSITPGSTTITTTGTQTFAWPDADVVTIELWGAGGSGSGSSFLSGAGTNIYSGTKGGDTTLAALSLTAGGGSQGGPATENGTAALSTTDGNRLGPGGTATGFNTTNTSGGNGIAGTTGGKGGDGANGGTGGALANPGGNGAAPGGGGGSGNRAIGGNGGSGGGGAYGKHVVDGGLYPAGTTVTVVIGAGGIHKTVPVQTTQANGGDGGNGKAVISWA